MTPEEYDLAEKTSIEMLEWLQSKNLSTHVLSAVLLKSNALLLAQIKKPGISLAKFTAGAASVFRAEIKKAVEFIQQHPAKQ